jgi:hypothetical protein
MCRTTDTISEAEESLNLIKVLFLKERTDFEPIVEVLATTLPKRSRPERLATISSKAAEGQNLDEIIVGQGRNNDIVTIDSNVRDVQTEASNT